MMKGREGENRTNGERDDPGLALGGHKGVVQFDEEMELTTMVLVLERGQAVLVNRVLFGTTGGDDKLEDSKCFLFANNPNQFVHLRVSGEINRACSTLNRQIGVFSLAFTQR